MLGNLLTSRDLVVRLVGWATHCCTMVTPIPMSVATSSVRRIISTCSGTITWRDGSAPSGGTVVTTSAPICWRMELVATHAVDIISAIIPTTAISVSWDPVTTRVSTWVPISTQVSTYHGLIVQVFGLISITGTVPGTVIVRVVASSASGTILPPIISSSSGITHFLKFLNKLETNQRKISLIKYCKKFIHFADIILTNATTINIKRSVIYSSIANTFISCFVSRRKNVYENFPRSWISEKNVSSTRTTLSQLHETTKSHGII